MNFKSHANYQKFLSKSLLAIDFGQKVIGLATFLVGQDPYPLIHSQFPVQSFADTCKQLSMVINEESIDHIIVGLPFYTDGTESYMTRKVRDFVKSLSQYFPQINFHLQDETLSTQSAKERMMASPQFNYKIDYKKIDALSAVIILEDFITSPSQFELYPS